MPYPTYSDVPSDASDSEAAPLDVSQDVQDAQVTIDLPLDALNTENPLDSLPFFWQPQKNLNFRLRLPLHPEPASVIQHIHESYFLDYLMFIGRHIGLAPVIIGPEIAGESS